MRNNLPCQRVTVARDARPSVIRSVKQDYRNRDKGISDAQEHLASLVAQMIDDGRIDSEDFSFQIGHAYAHLRWCMERTKP